MSVLARETSSSSGTVYFDGGRTSDSNGQEIYAKVLRGECLRASIEVFGVGSQHFAFPRSQHSLVLGKIYQNRENWIGKVEWLPVFDDELDDIRHLEEGWDGYSAPPPNVNAFYNARRFLDSLAEENLEPSHMGPSVSGGIGFTLGDEGKEYVVEFLNTGITMRTFIVDLSGEREVTIGAIRDEDPSYFLLSEIRNLNIV